MRKHPVLRFEIVKYDEYTFDLVPIDKYFNHKLLSDEEDEDFDMSYLNPDKMFLSIFDDIYAVT